MKIPTVHLPAAVPRDAALVRSRVDLHVHLRPLYVVGALCAAGGAALLARVARAGVADERDWSVLGLGVGLSVAGAWILVSAVGRWRARLRALTHGRLMQAAVTGHATEPGRRWLLLKGREQHVVRAAVKVDGRELTGEFRLPYAAVAEAMPVGTRVTALVDVERGALTFPHDLLIGVELDG